MASENSLSMYRTTIRSAARKVVVIESEYGIKAEVRSIIGLFGWQIKNGERTVSGAPVSAVRALIQDQSFKLHLMGTRGKKNSLTSCVVG